MSSETPRALLRPLLARRLSPSERRALAAELLAIAAEQERLASAERADLARPAPQRITGAGVRTGRPGATHVYLDVRQDRTRSEPTYTLRIGRGVFDAYQTTRRDPRADLRLVVQLTGRQLRLVEDPAGYLVTVNVGGVRLNVSGSRDELAALPAGVRWQAEARPGVIVVEL